MTFDLSDLVGAVEQPAEADAKGHWLVVGEKFTSSEQMTKAARLAGKIMKLAQPMVFIGEAGDLLNAKEFPPNIGTPERAISWLQRQRKSIR
jgi:hypothetical protein